ncbi:MAG: alpha-galactosidase [Schleiferilactobacillus harbinensis]
MADLIAFDAKTQVFHLHNQQISYIFAIEDGGVLGHLYFGQAVAGYHGERRYPRKDRGFAGNLPVAEPERGFSLDTLPQEISSRGEADFRIPAFVIRQADGAQASRFVYASHRIVPGKPKLPGLPAAYVESPDEAATLIVTVVDQPSRLQADLYYTIYRDRAVIARSVCFRNPADQPAVTLEQAASVQLDFPAGDYRVLSLPGAHANERHLQKEVVGYGIKQFASTRGTTSHQMNNFIALTAPDADEFHGDVYGIDLVYSGNHALTVEKDQIDQVRVVAGINPAGFTWELAGGAEFQTPEALLVYSHQGLNAMSQTYHRLIRERVVRGRYRDQERPILVNNWEATYFDFNEAKLRPIVDAAKKLGIEMFVLDDGWFGHRDDDTTSLGDWVVDSHKFPLGLKHFADYVHNQGLKFGLWVEPEMISKDSDLYRTHPDYLLAVPGRAPSPSRFQYVLDLSREDVRANIAGQLSDLLDQGYIDYIKWDMNRHLSDIYSHALPAARQGEVLHRYTLGLYALLEELTTKYPDVLWEGCSGGGGRIDTGFAYYMPQSWTSDNTDAISRLGIQYGTSLVYPPNTFTAHVSVSPNEQTGRSTSLTTRGNVAMSAVFGYELDLTKLTKTEQKQVAAQVAAYKQIRSLIQFGHFLRLESGNDYAWMFVSADQNEALLFTFHLLNNGQPAFHIVKMAGLDPAKQYEDTATHTVYGGDELMHMGLYQPLQRQDFTTHQYHFKAIN